MTTYKSLRSPSVQASGVAVSHTGDTAETVLATIAIPAGEIGANGQVVVVALFTRAGVAAPVSAAVRFGAAGSGLAGTTVVPVGGVVGTTNLSNLVLCEFGNASSASAQVFYPFGTTGAPYQTQNPSAIGAAAINTALATEINITGKCGNAGDTVTLKYWRVAVYPAA